MAEPRQKAQQIASALMEQIAGEPDGARLPGEQELARRFGTSRFQVRSAVEMLIEQNLVRRSRGVGTYVSRPVEMLISSKQPPSFHAIVQAAGHRPRTKRVDIDQQAQPPVEMARMLGQTEGLKVIRLTRLGWVDDRIACCSYEWILPHLVSEVGVALGAVESLHEVLRMGRHHPKRARSTVSTEYPPADIARRLELPRPALAWRVQTLSVEAETSAPLMVSRTWHRQDVVRVTVES
ncbi:GntR family transcriptional regulator [Nesterenkonia ebinurensis]|uniref:GntR family transcriptional regulator n=1 Tax=Nesterenkonia ebinurensis TaxID=2608252 RepID=UPI00123CB608|nr:GntR family transcriptional regulator [Nesterenkonia ebinurensis]